VYQHLSLQDPPKFTQIEIFGLKIYHLATLAATRKKVFEFNVWREEKAIAGKQMMLPPLSMLGIRHLGCAM
jgi:hypothetical protein